MKRRTEIRLKNFRLFMKKNILTSRFIVRNTLVVMTAAAAAGTAVFTVKAFGTAGAETAVVQQAEENQEEKNEEKTLESAVVYLQDTALLTDGTDQLKDEIAAEASYQISANDVSTLTDAKYDMQGRFLVKADGLNVRSSASEDADIETVLAANTAGDVVSQEGDWTEISSGDVTGYVKSEYIYTDDEASAHAEDALVKIATVTASEVNVRESADSDAGVMYIAHSGDSFVTVEENSGSDWTNVQIPDGTTGYIATDYLSAEDGFAEAVSQEEKDAVAKARAQYAADQAAKEGRDSGAGNTAETKESTPASGTKQENSVKNSTADTQGTAQKTTAPAETGTTAAAATTEAAPAQTTAPSSQTVASASDYALLCAIVYAEDGSEGYDGQLAVANVILNRLHSGKWGSTLSGVIYAPSQFTAVSTQAFQTALSTGGSATTQQAVTDALNGVNNVGGCMGFRPIWNIDLSSIGSYIQYGTVIFF